MIAQEAFYIPAHVAEGILKGKYQRIGGVVRWAVGPQKGQIVKLLHPVKIEEGYAVKSILARGMEAIQANPKAAIGVGVGVAVGSGVLIYNKFKNREPAALKDFRNSLNPYVEAIRNGDMNLEIIDNMAIALKNLKQNEKYKEYRISLSAGDIETLVNRIHDYTCTLAENNGLEFDEIDKKQSDDIIVDFEKYIAIQRKVFDEAV